MTAPRLKRLRASDYPGSPAWLADVFGPLNTLLSDLQGTLGRRTLGFKTLELSTPAAVADAFPLTLAHDLDGPPKSVSVASVADADDSRAVFTTAVFPTWELSSDGTQVVIRYLSGLTASHRYAVALRMEAL